MEFICVSYAPNPAIDPPPPVVAKTLFFIHAHPLSKKPVTYVKKPVYIAEIKYKLRNVCMENTAKQLEALREKLIAEPEVILNDPDLMRALVAANDAKMGSNIIDLRGVAMDRLEARLDRMEETHRTVIAAAYTNQAGTNQIHRAILRMLAPAEFEGFLRDLDGEVASILGVDTVRLVLETNQNEMDPGLKHLGDVLNAAEPGFVEAYLTLGKRSAFRPVTLRQVQPDSNSIYGKAGEQIRSEAVLMLNFGDSHLPGMLVMGAKDPHHFEPNQGTDLLVFFAGVFERAMRRWLS